MDLARLRPPPTADGFTSGRRHIRYRVASELRLDHPGGQSVSPLVRCGCAGPLLVCRLRSHPSSVKGTLTLTRAPRDDRAMGNDVHEQLGTTRANRMKIEERQRPDRWDRDLRAICGERIRLDDLELKIIWRLRVDHGESWAEIGRRLGVSKQGAWERFGKPFPTQGGLAPGPDTGD
jgi:hypothetical protein